MTALSPRLSFDEMVAGAVAVESTPALLRDPRLAETALEAIYATGVRVLLAWPDGSLGHCWFRHGEPVCDAIAKSYDLARSAFEAIHLQHAAPVGAVL